MINSSLISIPFLLRHINIIKKIINPNKKRPPRIEPIIIPIFFPK
jgi:hypothetical protein